VDILKEMKVGDEGILLSIGYEMQNNMDKRARAERAEEAAIWGNGYENHITAVNQRKALLSPWEYIEGRSIEICV